MILLPLICATSVTLAGCDKLHGGVSAKTAFNAEAAMGYIKTQMDFGPRVPGTPAHRKTGDWIIAEMKKRTDSVIVQSWTHTTARGESLPLRNIFARFNPTATQRVLYVTHWDSRPTADEDLNFGNRQLPTPGANDGASGVAMFIALGDVFKQTPPSIGVDLLFVDGEDWGDFGVYNDTSTAPDVLIGSTYFALHLPEPGYKPIFGVLWDMIGDADLQIYQEEYSVSAAPEVVSRVWQAAADLGYAKQFIRQTWGPITDDHVPLIRKAGMRVIDVIDIQYGKMSSNSGPGDYPDPSDNYHHTLKDTIDKVSAKSLQIVGDVALMLVK